LDVTVTIPGGDNVVFRTPDRVFFVLFRRWEENTVLSSTARRKFGLKATSSGASSTGFAGAVLSMTAMRFDAAVSVYPWFAT
jgi:hypothetical protein